MEKELAISFNIKLSSEILRDLKSEQEKLLKLFNEQRFYDSSPHLAIAIKFMGNSSTQQFVDAMRAEFKNEKAWELEFADFRSAQTGDYIFLHLSNVSREKLFNLHERALNVTKQIGFEKPDSGKFRNFPYDPHISIIKLEPEYMEKAIATIKKNMLGIKMPVSQYVITKQTDDEKGFANFPVVCKINLK